MSGCLKDAFGFYSKDSSFCKKCELENYPTFVLCQKVVELKNKKESIEKESIEKESIEKESKVVTKKSYKETKSVISTVKEIFMQKGAVGVTFDDLVEGVRQQLGDRAISTIKIRMYMCLQDLKKEGYIIKKEGSLIKVIQGVSKNE